MFIFFFRAAFEPKFIFELTPFYLLSGLSNVQLGLLSLMVILADMYLHLRSGKRNLLLSFLPTSVMLSSLGFTIMFSPMDIAYVYHYSLFGCLLLVVLIDYQYVLTGVETPTIIRKKEPVRNKSYGEGTCCCPSQVSLCKKCESQSAASGASRHSEHG